MALRALLVGESWSTVEIHTKGFDQFITGGYDEGSDRLLAALQAGGLEVDHLRSQEVPRAFPTDLDALRSYDVVILSDIGSNSLLLHPDTFTRSKRTPNRLKLLRDYVGGGAGLIMIGGYMSFQGIDGRARYAGTPVEEVLPVNMLEVDDRVEVPEGVEPLVLVPEHPVLTGLGDWPFFLGYNRVKSKATGEVLATVQGDVFIATSQYGDGRAAVFTSDCAPHWGPPEFLEWDGYTRFWVQMTRWLAKQL